MRHVQYQVMNPWLFLIYKRDVTGKHFPTLIWALFLSRKEYHSNFNTTWTQIRQGSEVLGIIHELCLLAVRDLATRQYSINVCQVCQVRVTGPFNMHIFMD